MNQSIVPVAPSWTDKAYRTAARGRLKKALLAGICLLGVILAVTARPRYFESWAGGLVIIAAALVPLSMWLYQGAKGFPLFPLFALTHIWTFGFPLIYEHRVVMLFSADSHLTAAVSVAGFLLLGTLIWSQVGRHPLRLPTRYRVLPVKKADVLFLLTLGAGILFTASRIGGWVELPVGLVSVVNAGMLALGALAAFILSYHQGKRQLSQSKRLLFFVLTAGLILVNLMSLVMIGPMSVVALALLGFSLGARRVPWLFASVIIAIFVFLHFGKGEIRQKYWFGIEDPVIQPSAYVGILTGWINASRGALLVRNTIEEDYGQSLVERASLMQILLHVQAATPDDVSYLYGATYRIIPSLLLPLIVYAAKATSHQGTNMLNVHYGYQNEDDTKQATLAFGLVNESFANFGYLGMGALAVLLATFYATIENWSRLAPVLSVRSLFAVLVASYAFQTEFTAGVFVAALFQSSMALVGVALFLTRSEAPEAGAS